MCSDDYRYQFIVFERLLQKRQLDLESEEPAVADGATISITHLLVELVLADTPAKLFDIRRISIEADTTSGTVATAAKLGRMIDRFKSEPDAWWDDVLIAEMIGLARETGRGDAGPDRAPANGRRSGTDNGTWNVFLWEGSGVARISDNLSDALHPRINDLGVIGDGTMFEGQVEEDSDGESRP